MQLDRSIVVISLLTVAAMIMWYVQPIIGAILVGCLLGYFAILWRNYARRRELNRFISESLMLVKDY